MKYFIDNEYKRIYRKIIDDECLNIYEKIFINMYLIFD